MSFSWLLFAFIIGLTLTFINVTKTKNHTIFRNLNTSEIKEEIGNILDFILEKQDINYGFIYSGIENYDELKFLIEKYKKALSTENKEILEQLHSEFLPTAVFQELSIQNDWTNDFLKIASKFDILHKELLSRI